MRACVATAIAVATVVRSSARLAVTSANVNKCREGTAPRDQNGLFEGWNRQEKKVVSGADASQADVVEYRMMRFDANRRQAQDIQCVLSKSESSKNIRFIRVSGKGRANFENAVGVIAIPVGDALQDCDLVGAAFERARIDGDAAVAQDPVKVALQQARERAEGGDPTLKRPPPPLLPEATGRLGIAEAPELFEIVLEHVDGKQPPIRAKAISVLPPCPRNRPMSRPFHQIPGRAFFSFAALNLVEPTHECPK